MNNPRPLTFLLPNGFPESSSVDYSGLTIDVLYFPSEAFAFLNYLEYDGYFKYLIDNFSPKGVEWNISTFTQDQRAEFLAAAQQLAPGSVVVMAPRHYISSDIEDKAGRIQDDGCVYCFGTGNTLLYEDVTQVSMHL